MIYERSLRVEYNDKKAILKKILGTEKTEIIHTITLQILVTEMFQVKIGKMPTIMHKDFQIENPNNYKWRKK